jgi:microcin C transport system substrate-binding protein
MRRIVLALAAALVASAVHIPSLHAEPQWTHALALIGTPKYPADFKHFDYVNPAAPQVGVPRAVLIISIRLLPK